MRRFTALILVGLFTFSVGCAAAGAVLSAVVSAAAPAVIKLITGEGEEPKDAKEVVLDIVKDNIKLDFSDGVFQVKVGDKVVFGGNITGENKAEITTNNFTEEDLNGEATLTVQPGPDSTNRDLLVVTGSLQVEAK